MIGAITRLRKAARAYGFSETKTKNKLGERMIKQLLTSVIAKYLDLSVSRRSIICLSLRLGQMQNIYVTTIAGIHNLHLKILPAVPESCLEVQISVGLTSLNHQVLISEHGPKLL